MAELQLIKFRRVGADTAVARRRFTLETDLQGNHPGLAGGWIHKAAAAELIQRN